MRILLLAVGRDRRGPTTELVETYLTRCPWKIEQIEIVLRSQGTADRRRREEAEKIRQCLPPNAAVIVLDERGDDITSPGLARQIGRFQEDGRAALAFVIGGADGLDPEFVEKADRRIAFGRAVWPHRLVKVMLAEQLYRASTILSGHPYHRD